MINNLKSMVMVFVLFLFSSFYSVEAEDMKLPLEGGYSYKLTVGYDGESVFTNDDGTPYVDKWHQGDHYYALDFDNPINYLNPKVAAILSGEIISAKFKAGSDGYDADGYGNYVKVKHSNGDVSLYAHLSEIRVVENEKIVQGQILGTMGTTGNSSGTHLHFELKDSDGNSKMPEPMSGYTDFTVGQTYLSDNYFTAFNFNDGTSQGWTPGNDAKNIPFISTRAGTWVIGVGDFDGIGGAHPGVLSPLFNGISTNHFSTLRFTVRISAQSLGVKQGDVWIKTPGGNWDHQLIFTYLSDDGGGFHTYQAVFVSDIFISQLSIEFTRPDVYEEWEFDEIRLIERKPETPKNLKVTFIDDN